MMKMKNARLRPLYSILLLFIGAPVLGMLAAPWVYRWLQSFAADGSVLDAPFHRVTSRLVLLMAAVLLFPVCKLCGFRSKADFGFAKCANWRSQFWLGIGLGTGSMLIVYLLGVLLGAYVWDFDKKTVASHLGAVAKILAGGLFAGVVEELFFRGFIFGALRKSLGVVAGILISSFFCSIIHFMRPSDPAVTDAWNSGFILFGNLFARAGANFLQEACTLFCMGLVLTTLYQWLKSVYLIIGLHTGWVWVIMLFRRFTDNWGRLEWLYGHSDWVSKSWMGSILAISFLIVVLLTSKHWKHLAEVSEI